MEAIIKNLHDAVRIIKKEERPGLSKTSYETHIAFVDFVGSGDKLKLYEYTIVPINPSATSNGAPFKPDFNTVDLSKYASPVYDYITTKLADSPHATDMCVGINPEYTKEALQDVELGFFVFGMEEREKKQTEKLFKEFHGFMTCRVNSAAKTLKIDLICARLRGLGTQLMKTIFGYATLYNYQRIKLDAATDLLACFYYPRFNFELTDENDKANKEEICQERTVLRSDTGTRALVRKLEDKMYPMELELKTYNSKLRSAIEAREAAIKAREAAIKAREAEAAEEAAEAAEAAEAREAEAREAEETAVEAEKAAAEEVINEYEVEAAAAEAARKAAAEATTEAAAEAETTGDVLLGYAIEDFEEQSKIIRYKKARKGGKTIEQAAKEANLSEAIKSILEEIKKEEAAAAAEAAAGGPAPAAPAAGRPAAAPPPQGGNGRTRKRKRSLKKKKKGGKNKTKRLKRKVGRNTRKKRNNVH